MGILEKAFGIDMPLALTWKGWREWEEKLKAEHPVYCKLREVRDGFNYAVSLPFKWGREVRWFLSKWFNHSNRLKTSLKRGRYHEFDTLLVDNVFTTFIDYVEVELAYKSIWCGGEVRKQLSFFDMLKAKWGCFRSAKIGLDHLEWEKSLGEESLDQSERAIQKLEIYNWIKNRANRVDPYTETGVHDLLTDDMLFEPMSSHPEYEAAYKRTQELMEKYSSEDTEMLIRIVKMRDQIWS